MQKSLLINLIFVEIVGIVILVQIFLLFGGSGNFNWGTINLHGFLMAFATIFLSGNGLIIYRLFTNTKTDSITYLHAFIHTCSLVIIIIGLLSAYAARNTHFRSLHAWLGLITIIIFILQYIIGLVMSSLRCINEDLQEQYSGIHAFVGIWNFLLASTVACLGLTSFSNINEPGTTIKYSQGRHYRNITCYGVGEPVGNNANLIGTFITFFTSDVFYITVNQYYEWERVY